LHGRSISGFHHVDLWTEGFTIGVEARPVGINPLLAFLLSLTLFSAKNAHQVSVERALVKALPRTL
jgi:hypothetical protein